ncbi:MAG: diacylglycerol kinase family lipid kinase [Actinobacteria bacterium]|nr:diacylglycerol kinase family lipid kinase [Actinomycetota bacterium]
MEKRVIGVFVPKTTAAEIIKEVRKSCVKESIKLDIKFTKHPKHAMELAKGAKNKYDMVIVAGGDGTVNEVINGISDSKITLAIIPFGSTNVLALELGIPFNAKEASELIAHGKRLKIDLGYAKTNEEARYFSMMVEVGFAPKLIKGINLKVKKRWGKLAYLLSGIRQLLTYEWYNIHVEHKSHSVGYFVIVSNSKDYAGEYQIADKASTTDGLLDLVVINRKSWWKIIKFISSLSSGKSNTYLRGEYYQIKEAHIYSRHKMLVQVDGELIGTAPVDVKVVPKALTVMVKR